MQANKEIVVTIKRDGEVVIEANNFKGVGCKDATKELVAVLAGGGSAVDSKPKDDFYQSNPGTNTITR